jgi:hypothetical protein
MYLASDKELEDFLASQVPLSTQDAALKSASRKKMASLTSAGVHDPQGTERLVDAIAKITAVVQTKGPDERPLKSSERGVFLVDIGAPSAGHPGAPSLSRLRDLLKEADEAGYLRLIESEGVEWRFRAHCSLAPAYGFSYRGAYYDVRVDPRDLARLADARDAERAGTIIQEIGERLSGQSEQKMPLFDRE